MPYRLGLPAWAFPGWRSVFFESEPSMLSSYASVFNTVEGNTTFYSIPSVEKVLGWRVALQHKDFKISFKLPRSITHQQRFNEDDFRVFLDRMDLLSDFLGPFLLQFPDWADIAHLQKLDEVYAALALRTGAVVEVRHLQMFRQPELLEPLLNEYGFGRCMLDSRALYAGDSSHPDVQAAEHRKPAVPVLPLVYNELAFVRLILHPAVTGNDHYIQEWAMRTAGWINDGITPVIMIHCPNNYFCPEFALRFHAMLQTNYDGGIPQLPSWPVPQQGQLW